MFWIVVAAQLSAPQPVKFTSWFSHHDMPVYVQMAGVTRLVGIRTIVRPDGSIQECQIESASGDTKLDSHTCALFVRRAKFEPAKWIDGSPSYGVFRMPFTWAIGGPPSERALRKAYPSDIEVSVNRLPRGARSAGVQLAIGVDESGRVVACEEARPIPGLPQKKNFPELVPIACEQLLKTFTAVPAKDLSGKGVRSVQVASVSFSTTGR